jgi:hypothetical protein
MVILLQPRVWGFACAPVRQFLADAPRWEQGTWSLLRAPLLMNPEFLPAECEEDGVIMTAPPTMATARERAERVFAIFILFSWLSVIH